MLSRLSKRRDEEGFTLIELLVVIIIIGILAAIAIPVFLNQRASAARASLESDARNAAIQIETEFTETGAYPVAVPPEVVYSENNTLGVVNGYVPGGNSFTFCVEALTGAAATSSVVYDSANGGIQPVDAVACS